MLRKSKASLRSMAYTIDFIITNTSIWIISITTPSNPPYFNLARYSNQISNLKLYVNIILNLEINQF